MGAWLLGLRWGLCCSSDSLISIEDGLSDTEGTDDAAIEGTNFLSGGFNVYECSTNAQTVKDNAAPPLGNVPSISV